MNKILPAIRTLLMDHLAMTEVLLMNVPIGGTLVVIGNTSRFRIGDQIAFLSNTLRQGEFVTISDIPDYNTIVLSTGSLHGWTIAQGSYITKCVNNEFIKGIYIGDIKMIPAFPAITIDVESESNEWLTLRQTSHEYKFRIRAYVLQDNFETTNLRLLTLATQIREILLDHIRPIIDGVSFPLTADLPAGQTIVNVSNTSQFRVGGPVFLRDAHPRPAQQESYVKSIIDSTSLEINIFAENDYLMSREAEIILVNRLLYDTRPESINYGVVNKGGTFCRAAEISWFAKEMKIREGNINT